MIPATDKSASNHCSLIATRDTTASATRVLHIIDNAEPHEHLLAFADFGDRQRFIYDFAVLGESGPLLEEVAGRQLQAFSLNGSTRWQLPAAMARLTRRLREQPVSIVQTHLLESSLIGLVTARLVGVPVRVFVAHHCAEVPYFGRKVGTADRFAHSILATHVVAPSQEMATGMVHAGTPVDRLHTIPHGIDLQAWRAGLSERQAVREELGIGENIMLISIGRVCAIKNQTALVRAFSRVHQEIPDLRLVLVGGGDTDALQGEIRRTGTDGAVQVTGPRTDVSRLLAAADVYVHPALTESFGLTLLEAAAMGCPIVSTSVGIAPTLLESDRTGVLIDETTDDAIERGLRDMLTLRAQWPVMSTAVAQRANAFTSQRMVQSYECLYTDAIKKLEHK